MREFIEKNQYSLSAEANWYLYRGFKCVDGITGSLKARHWETLVSKSGNFIGSDNPVMMDGPKGEWKIGFKSAEAIIFPVSRHILLYGTNRPVVRKIVNRDLIAFHNTFTMITADEQVYSHVPDFCWLDEANQY